MHRIFDVLLMVPLGYSTETFNEFSVFRWIFVPESSPRILATDTFVSLGKYDLI